MKGTFKLGDKLIVEKVAFKQLKKGDVIIYRRTREDQNDFIAHRVTGIFSKGLITRGDNCFNHDSDPVTNENVIGRVIRYDRKEKIHRAWNGSIGRIRATLLHARQHAVGQLKCILSNPHIMLKKTGIIAKLWHPEIELIQFETPDGPLIKYLHYGKTVAIFQKSNSRFCIKQLFDLVVIRKP